MKRTYDAILLLGLRLNPDGSAQEEMLLRSKKAAELWKAGVAPVIVACGGPTGGSGRTEAEVLKEELVSLGVAESAVLLCPAPKASCSLSSRRVKPESPPGFRSSEKHSRRPVSSLCT